jgi:hypothetical protein
MDFRYRNELSYEFDEITMDSQMDKDFGKGLQN